MLTIEKKYSLKKLNTFGINAIAQSYSRLDNLSQLPELQQHTEFQNGLMILGGGSNWLLTQNVNKWVIHNQLKGIKIVGETPEAVDLEVAAGEVWHDFVLFAINAGYGGLENLSLIPGTVGATPVQNIGAYGAEAKDVIVQVNAWHIEKNEPCSFQNADCHFGYRDSVFKREWRHKAIITSVVFRLSKKPKLNIGYGTVANELKQMGISEPTLKAVSEAVCNIRRAKLPDPAVIGNAGSFFKNPIISKSQFDELKSVYHEIPSYPTENGLIKIPAAWLIEQCHWKGYRRENVGVHERQPLVLVNFGGANGQDIYFLSQDIMKSVTKKFDIKLEREVQIYGAQ